MKIKYTIFLVLMGHVNLSISQDIDLSLLPEVEEYNIVLTNPDADTVLIALHGGPSDDLNTGDFDYFHGISTFSVVEMMKQNHLNPEILSNFDLSLSEAVSVNDTTVALLKKSVDHYKRQGKFVAIIGHSFGSYILLEYLDDYGVEDVNKFIPTGARLNTEEEVIDAFLMGNYVNYKDGLFFELGDTIDNDLRSFATLAAASVLDRYVDSLSMLDLSKMMFVFGQHDSNVGRLLEDEIRMLTESNATILEIENGSHSSPLYSENLDKVLQFIRDDFSVSNIDLTLNQDRLKVYPTIANNFITVETNTGGTFFMFNSYGQPILETVFEKGINIVDLSNLVNGNYHVLFHSQNNTRSNSLIVVLN